VKALGELLAGKADPNVRFGLDEKGRFIQDRAQGPTPLMIAARGGHLTCMEILVEAGADPTLRDAAGLTAEDHLNRFLAREVPRINKLMRGR
jgi:ankyrin repeat protein